MNRQQKPPRPAKKTRQRPQPPAAKVRARDAKGTLRKLGGLLSGFKGSLFAIALLSVLSVVFQILGPFIMAIAINVIAEGVTLISQGTGTLDLSRLLQLLIFLAAIYLLQSVFLYVQQSKLAVVTQKVMYHLREQIDKKIKRLPLSYFDKNTLGDILSRVTNDVDTVSTTLQQSLPQLVTSLLSLIMALVMMLTVSPSMTLFGLIPLPVMLIFSMIMMVASQKHFKGQQKGLGDLNGYIEESFTGHTVTKAFGHEEESLREFTVINDKLYEHSWKSQFVSGMIMPISSFFGNVGYVIVAIMGAFSVLYGQMQIGTVQMFLQYLRMFTQPITQVATMSTMIQSTIAAAERIFDFLEEAEEPPNTANPVVLSSPQGQVALENIRFGYSPDNVLIKDLSIDLKSGDKIAIVGPTGAGKTTLVNLLLRFYDIQGGRITIDGVDIMDMRRSDLRRIFGMVLQDTWLFSGTIEDNIRYGKLSATDEEVRQAAKAAYADSFIRSLPGGYKMDLSEDAATLSGGQKQLITIARAILSDPVILILDEATSSVDTRTELLIQRAMERLMTGRTSFVIAHRLSTIRDSQMILVMDQGDIVETGNHEELLAKNGFYAKLYQSQFAQSEDEPLVGAV